MQEIHCTIHRVPMQVDVNARSGFDKKGEEVVYMECFTCRIRLMKRMRE